MSQRIDAIFENGVFRPEVAVNIPDGERVLLHVESKGPVRDDLSDIADVLDIEYTEACRRRRGTAPSLEEVRRILSKFTGSLADRISEERDER
jgi:predicted DNA-binding antitoxin AbrB/MazE fold protein